MFICLPIIYSIFADEFESKQMNILLGVQQHTLTSSIIVLRFRSPNNQRIAAVPLLLVPTILSYLVNDTDPLAQLIMQLFSIKLILAFLSIEVQLTKMKQEYQLKQQPSDKVCTQCASTQEFQSCFVCFGVFVGEGRRIPLIQTGHPPSLYGQVKQT